MRTLAQPEPDPCDLGCYPTDAHLTGTLISQYLSAADLPAAPFTAEQVLDMFAALPPEAPIEMKRR